MPFFVVTAVRSRLSGHPVRCERDAHRGPSARGSSPARSTCSRAAARSSSRAPAEAGEVIELDREHLLALVQTDSELGEIIMRAFILRRVELIAHGLGDVVLVGSDHCAGTLRVKEFLTRNGHPYALHRSRP